MLPGRTTSALVDGIIETDVAISLDPFIDSANELVTELCAITAGTPPTNIYGYGTARLELIERWLAAHFYAIRDPRAQDERAGSVGESTPAQLDKGLKNTTYGQQALRLDTAGCLAVMDNGMDKFASVPRGLLTGVKIGVSWLGKRCPTRVRDTDCC